VNLRLEPVVMKSPSLRHLIGMGWPTSPRNSKPPDLDKMPGRPRRRPVRITSDWESGQWRGEYFWMVGNKEIANVPEMVAELLRINEA
jgi:hypothetical protein